MSTPQPPVDTSVPLPPSVAKLGADADALHQRMYPKEQPAVAPAKEDIPQPAPVSSEPAVSAAAEINPQGETPAPEIKPQVEPEVVVQAEPAPNDAEGWRKQAEQERHKFLSMQGRYAQASKTIGSLQEQMQELGDELVRTQQHHQRRPQAAVPRVPAQPQRLITDEDVKTYGPDVIDLAKRAALEAVAPDLVATRRQVAQVSQQVKKETTGNVYKQLQDQVPNWREINKSAEFARWCSLRDVYSGEIRRDLLNKALTAAQAPRVIQFFRGFLAEGQATGQTASDAPVQPAPPPRTAARTLEAIAAPGRAKPAAGATPGPAEKPNFTHAQIKDFYADVRRNVYAGRLEEKDKIEQAIFAAQREGRIK